MTTAIHESRCLIFQGSDAARALKDSAEISDLLKLENTFVWFDLTEPTPDDLAMLQEEFGLHPMAVEDAALAHERPKIEAYDHYWLVVAHAATIDDDNTLAFNEVAIFVSAKFVVTIRTTPLLPLTEIERRWKMRGAIPHDAAGLLYVILDVIVDSYFPIAQTFDERLSRLEDLIFEEANVPERALRAIFKFKRELIRFRHAVEPMRDMLSPILRNELQSLDATMSAYFRDVSDHALRTLEQIDATRDILNSTLDIHLSSQSNRQAEVGKQLTIIATIFLPLTYITGFFGQNFGWMVNGIVSPQTFWFLGVGSQVAAIVILMGYFRFKRWF